MRSNLSSTHYLHRAQLVGEQLRYAVVWKGQWLAVAAWSAAAFHLKARDKFIGWTENNDASGWPWWSTTRVCVSCPTAIIPIWSAGSMKLMLGRLSADWQSTWGHPVALAESFVTPSSIAAPPTRSAVGASWDPRAAGSAARWISMRSTTSPNKYGSANWTKKACVKLRAAELPAPWVCALSHAPPRCTAKAGRSPV